MSTAPETAGISPGLERLDENQISDSYAEIRLFAKVRNEARRLPYFLAYYRKLGINRFFIVDNCSTDHTIDILRQNSDCHVFGTDQSMALSSAGMNWIEPLLAKYGENRWCLIVDADELLVYPNSKNSLAEFCQKLDRAGANAMPCIMLDMYPRGNIKDIVYREGQSFIEACPFFDRSGYKFLPSNALDIPMIIGGPRLRMFYPEFLDSGIAHARRRITGGITRIPVLRKYLASLRKLPIPRRSKLLPPILNKVPLVRWNRDIKFGWAAHFVWGARLTSATGALLHFKFLDDFERRVNEEMARRVYYLGGKENERYFKYLQRHTRVDFGCALSTRYNGTEQLVELGLIKEIRT